MSRNRFSGSQLVIKENDMTWNGKYQNVSYIIRAYILLHENDVHIIITHTHTRVCACAFWIAM